jgi:hypothetical protein
MQQVALAFGLMAISKRKTEGRQAKLGTNTPRKHAYTLHIKYCLLRQHGRHAKYFRLNTLSSKEPQQLSRYSDCLRAGRRSRSLSPGRVKNFHFSTSSRPALRSTQPPIQWVPGALSTGVKRSGREADHSPPTSAEVKNTWIYTFTLLYVFRA